MARSTTPLRAIGATFALLLMSACASGPTPTGETRFVVVNDGSSSAGNLLEDNADETANTMQNEVTWRIDAPDASGAHALSCRRRTVGVDDLFDSARIELPVASP